jgi:hypothetical protein
MFTWQGTADERIDSRDLIAWLEMADEEDEDQLLADAVRTLADSGIEDWEYGATMIRADTFEDYAQEFADEIGAITSDSWPMGCIDWERAADELSIDYTTVEFLGHDYYVR